ncbi:MAG: NUDIX domain-containing protein [Verrucomicrobia bacterium]|nr:NUDIX domain-containing protein [Verrucomicrobiota bacterium]
MYPRVGVAVVVIHEGKILLGKRKGGFAPGQWSCAGGHLEFGESVEDCMRRELEEETGLRVISFKLGPWVSTVFDAEHHYITLYTFVHAFEGTPQLREPEKCEGWSWFSLSDLPTPLFATVQKALESGLLDEQLSPQ